MTSKADRDFQNTQRVHDNVSANSMTIIGWSIVFHAATFTSLFAIATAERINQIFWTQRLAIGSAILIAFFFFAYWRNEDNANEHSTNKKSLLSCRPLGRGSFAWCYFIFVLGLPFFYWISIAVCPGSFLEKSLLKATFHSDLVQSYTFDLENQNHLKVPYFAEFKRGEKLLLYVASQHISAKEYPDLLKVSIPVRIFFPNRSWSMRTNAKLQITLADAENRFLLSIKPES